MNIKTETGLESLVSVIAAKNARDTMEQYQSNALWPDGVCRSKWGDNISTDVHESLEHSAAVCRGLRREGFGGEGKIFPLCVWTSKVQQPPVLPENWNWQEPEDYYDSAEARRPLTPKKPMR